MKRLANSAIFICLLLSGCGAGIRVVPFDGTPLASVGTPYNLPMTTFKITILRTITKCGDTLEGTVVATIEPSIKIDPSQQYTLRSSGFWNTSDVKGTYNADKITTGLNTATEGQAGTALSDIVTTVATIAPLAAAFGAGDPKKEACGGTLADVVAEVSGPDGKSGLGAKVKQESVALAAATDKLTLLTTQVTALGSAISKQNQQDFWNAIEDVLTKKKQLAEDQAKLDADLKKISDTQVVMWPQRGDQLFRDATNPLKIVDKVFTQWANVTKPTDGEAIDQFNVYLSLESLDDGVVTPANPTAKTVKLVNTVPVRFAGSGILHVCTQAPCGDPASKEIAKLDGTVLQFGRVYYLPVGGNAFKSVTVATTLDDKGNPSSVHVANKSAMISNMAASGKAIATTVAGVPAAISAAETARTKAKTDQITAETALATAQAGAPNAGQIAILQAKTALATATNTQLNADAALKAATETKVS